MVKIHESNLVINSTSSFGYNHELKHFLSIGRGEGKACFGSISIYQQFKASSGKIVSGRVTCSWLKTYRYSKKVQLESFYLHNAFTYFRFRSSDRSWFDRPGLIEPRKNL